MSIDFEHSVDIDRPAAEVFAYVADFANNPEWQGGMTSCRWTSDPPMVVGATYAQEARFLGRAIHTHFRVSAVDPGRSISIESTKSTFPIQVTRRVEPTETGCRVTAHIRGQPSGLMRLFSGMVRRSVAKDYRELKRMLESSGAGSEG